MPSRWHGRGETFRRLLALRDLCARLESRPALASLAAKFGVSRRTLQRDLALLRDAGCRVPDWERP